MRPRLGQMRRSAIAAASLFFLLLCVLLGAQAADAGAPHEQAKGKRPSARILAPKEDARPESAKLTVRVRVRGKGFRALLDGRDVSGRFTGAGVRSATFERGRDFRPGQNSVIVTVGTGRHLDTDQIYFFARERDDGVLEVKRVGRQPYPAPRLHLRTQRRIAEGKVWLNGRRVDRRMDEDADLRGLIGQFGGANLRYGKNTVRIEVLQADGRFARRTLHFNIPRNRPIASAGPDRRAGVGAQVRLDGSASRQAAPPGATASTALEYSWKLLESPPGSEAKILQPDSPQPLIVPDEAGTYLAQLTVTNPEGIESVDDVELDAPQSVGPMGMPIQTITANGEIQIGDPDQAGAKTYPRHGDWVQMLVLDPDTGRPMGGKWDKHSGSAEKEPGALGFDTGQGGKLLEAVKATEYSQLVVLSGQEFGVSMGSGDASDLQKAIELLGGTVSESGPTPDGASDLASGQWSLIGNVGLVPGQAYQNTFSIENGIPGFLGGSAGSPGSLNGYLQSGFNQVGFQYVSPEYVPIDTKWTANLSEAPSPTQNTIKVGEQKYTSEPINTSQVAGCPCSVAIQALLLSPNGLAPIDGGTFGILTTNGSTDFDSVYQLDSKLREWVTNHGEGVSNLVILQDFGSQGCGCWPANSDEWLHDQLPDNTYTPRWKGGNYPSKLSELFKLWNDSEPHGIGTVAGHLGELAGPAAHDIVANYRRPVYVPSPAGGGSTVPRTWGGLTVVATTNRFQSAPGFVQGQGTLPPTGSNPLLHNGRVAGVLTRNNQAQWEMTGATQGAGYPGLVSGAEPNSTANYYETAALPRLVFRPQSPWPCSVEHPEPCSTDAGEVGDALAYISLQLRDTGRRTDIRTAYRNTEIAWSSLQTEIGFVKCGGQSDFSEATCEEMRKELGNEFHDISQVQTAFAVVAKLLGKEHTDKLLELEGAAEGVRKEIERGKRHLALEKAEFHLPAWIETALFVSSGVVQAAISGEEDATGLEFAPGAISAAAYLIQMGQKGFAFYERSAKSPILKVVPDDTTMIRDRTENLQKDIQLQLENTEGTLGHFEEIIRTDPVKLHEAAENFALAWELNPENEERIQQSTALGAAQSMYEALMPIAFNQWMISPRATNININAVVDLPDRGYNCDNLNEEGYIDGFDNPLSNEPASMSGMSSVQYTAAPEPDTVNYTVRALKAQESDIVIESAEFDVEYGNNYVERKGVSPSEEFANLLFEMPGDRESIRVPKRLGIDKDQFFGMQGWRIRKLQCGWAYG